MDPVAFRIGSWPVQWYGIIIVTGALLGGYVASWIAKRRQLDPDHVWNMLTVALLLGILGARAYHVFSRPAVGIGWDYYKQHPIDAIAFWKTGGFAGLGIYGGIIGGALGVFLYTWLNKLRFWQWVDLAAPGLLLGQAIGRWGNFVNQELYGPPTNLPWGIHIDCDHRYGDFLCPPAGSVAPNATFHPTFLYESLWSLIGVIIMLFLVRRFNHRLRTPDLFFIYLIYYPLGRFWIELFFRPDAWVLGSLPTASVLSLVAMAIGVAGLIYNHKFRKAPST